MVIFEKVNPFLYIQKDVKNFCVIFRKEMEQQQFNIEQAIKHQANFLFSNTPIDLSDNFLKNIIKVIQSVFGEGRGILWIKEKDNFSLDNIMCIGISLFEKFTVRGSTSIELSNNVNLLIQSATDIYYDENNIFIDGSGIKWEGYFSATSFRVIGKATISFQKESLGSLFFDMSTTYSDFIDFFQPGIEFVYHIENQMYGKNFNVFSKKYNFNFQLLYFRFSLFLCDIYNYFSKHGTTSKEIYNSHRSYMVLLDDTKKDVLFQSCYCDVFGNLISLRPTTDMNYLPSRFVFQMTYDSNGHCVSPEGDFLIVDNDLKMICGLSGTEFFHVSNQSFLRFISGQPALIEIDLKQASVGQIDDPYKPKILDTCSCSWLSVKNAGYVSQARELILYDYDKQGILKHCEIEIDGIQDNFYPMLPYSRVDLQDIKITPEIVSYAEHFIISAVRADKICAENKFCFRSFGNTFNKVATSNGFIVEIENSFYKNIYLSENENNKIYFEKPNKKLVKAFGAESLFLVCANTVNIGECVYNDNCGKQSFHCDINVENWHIKPDIGKSEYGNYRSIMIIKACKGKLYDEQNPEKSLCANTSMWTQREDFSSPIVNGIIKDEQQILLSQWLLNYCKKSYEMKSEYFHYFNSILADENWSGILFLNVPLKKGDMPEAFSGIFQNLTVDSICYHHFGIEINPIKIVDNMPVQCNQDNLFGLLYYQNTSLQNDIIEPVLPLENSDYDFKILSLKVLFQNSNVGKFESYAQIALNKIFNAKVYDCTNNYNCVILQGYLQNRNGVSYFAMKSDEKVIFCINSMIKNVGITSAEMMPLDENSSKILMQGYIDFDKNDKMDILSFGEENGNDGLCFYNLQLNIKKEITMQEENIAFDMLKSNIRENSFYQCMPLKVIKMLKGSSKDITKNYMDMRFNMGVATLKEEECHALEFEINLGGNGELSNNSLLNGKILIGWADNEKQLYIGIQILGIAQEGLIIQDFIKMTAENAELRFCENKYQIILSGVGLKLFSIAKIPPGSPLNIYLFSEKDSKSCGWFAVRSKQKKAGDNIGLQEMV